MQSVIWMVSPSKRWPIYDFNGKWSVKLISSWDSLSNRNVKIENSFVTLIWCYCFRNFIWISNFICVLFVIFPRRFWWHLPLRCHAFIHSFIQLMNAARCTEILFKIPFTFHGCVHLDESISSFFFLFFFKCKAEKHHSRNMNINGKREK